MSVATNIVQRTFNIRHKEKLGTCFTLDLDGRRYLVTARHIVEKIKDRDVISILHGGRWIPFDVALVGHGNGDVDVSVLAPQVVLGANHALNATTAGLQYAEDVFFLGFPYGLNFEIGALNAEFPVPLVKRAIVSALGLGDVPMLLDGHNNPGFSGGPVVRRWNSDGQTVVGVISEYMEEPESVEDRAGNELPYVHHTNTGIIVVWEIRHAIELVESNPIGLAV